MNVSDYMSEYSFLMAILFFQIMLVIVVLLRRRTSFLVKYSTSVLFVAFLFALIRISVPYDFSRAWIITSDTVLPKIQAILKIKVFEKMTIGSCIQSVWIIGTLIYWTQSIYQMIQEQRQHRGYLITDKISMDGCINDIPIYLSPNVSVPHIIGVRKSSIYLPALSLSEEDLKMVVQHELQHYKGRDIWIKMFYRCICGLFWWNPIVHKLQREVDALLELRCDWNLTKHWSENKKQEYLAVILKIARLATAKQGKRIKDVMTTSTLISFDVDKQLKQRFQIIMEEIKPSFINRWKGYIIILILFFSSYLILWQPYYEPPELEKLNETSQVEESNIFIYRDNKGKYKLCKNGVFVKTLRAEELNKEPYMNYDVYEDGKDR